MKIAIQVVDGERVIDVTVTTDHRFDGARVDPKGYLLAKFDEAVADARRALEKP